ncbi:pantoate--beta-alanine ligase [Tengunoibacter tsumagoiensis]|uniref:pantoate--beta-alanine ligase (AMP-forming) n=1 Tax=Tengunoibacter tsumagoiensis TaxID=2014871 RepID=A0A402A4T0_9CHLR|nr:pantoate--beta-alanine ligase [Tengunoibacter tsumagoiensis]GCE14153.1 pantothenate synthetase [Tengunoibacter tsumagoiensis]
MRIIDTLDEMVETARGWLSRGTVSLVPLSSDLHAGHTALLHAAHQAGEVTVVSLLQKTSLLGLKQALPLQPQPIVQKLRVVSHNNIDIVFIPQADEMYPPTFATYVNPGGPVMEYLLQSYTPEMIRIFSTTMCKLLQLVRPDIAFFGQKDALLVGLLRQLVRDLNIDVSLQTIPTARERDGLAISSRNLNFTPEERQTSTVLYQALCRARALIEQGEVQSSVLTQAMTTMVAKKPLASLEYIMICRDDTFEPLTQIQPGTLLSLGVRIGSIFLYDNLLWKKDGSWS